MKKIFTLFLLLLVVTTAKAEKWTPADGDELMTAIENANNGDEIILKAGTYNITATMTILGDRSITIIGAGADKVIIDGDDKVQIFNIISGNSLRIEGVTLQEGNSGGTYGGAIENCGSLFLTNCVLKENFSTEYGGAIWNVSGSAILTNCQLIDNRVNESYGAIYSTAPLTLINCVLTGNRANGDGGAIYTKGTTLIINTTITGNKAGYKGGGLCVDGNGEVIILNSIIVGNEASDVGDDIYNEGAIDMVYSAYGDYKDGDENVLEDGIENLSDILAINVLDTTSDFPKAKGDAATKGTMTAYDGTHGYFYDKRIPEESSLRSAGPRGWRSYTVDPNTVDFKEEYLLTPLGNTIMGAVIIEKEVEEDPGVHHELTFLVDEGIRINPDKTGYHIEEGHDYTFYMYMNAGFDQKKPYVTVNGQPVFIRETQDGTGWVYRIPAVYEDKTIEIVLQDLTDNLNPEEAGVVIYSSAGALIVDVAQSTSVTIYNITGQAVAQQTVEGRASFNLPKGIYIVKADGKATKAVVR